MRGSKTEIKKSSGQIFYVTIAYLKENFKIKDKFSRKFLPRIRKTYFLVPKWSLYTGKYGNNNYYNYYCSCKISQTIANS